MLSAVAPLLAPMRQSPERISWHSSLVFSGYATTPLRGLRRESSRAIRAWPKAVSELEPQRELNLAAISGPSRPVRTPAVGLLSVPEKTIRLGGSKFA